MNTIRSSSIALLLCTLVLAGCGAEYPLFAKIDLQTGRQAAGIYTNNVTIAVRGRDLRKQPAVIVYRLDDNPPIRLDSETPPHVLITGQLTAALQEQGLMLASDAPVFIQLDIKELLVTVTRPKFLYHATSRSRIVLTIHNGRTTFSKTFERENSSESMKRPKVTDLEAMLDKQLNEIVNRILTDTEIRSTIQKEAPQDAS